MSMIIASASMAVEARFDGVWTDITEDVRSSRGIKSKYGITGGGPRDRIASTGTFKYEMDNSDTNSAGLLGYYSPDHANARPYWNNGVQIRQRFTYSGSQFIKWRGGISDISPAAGRYLSRDVKVTATDWFDIAGKNKTSLLPTQFNQRADEGLIIILDDIANPPPASLLAVGQDTYPTIFDSTRDESTTITNEMAKLVVSELGFLYQTGDKLTGGVLTFEDRHARAKYGAAAASISGSMSTLNMSRSTANIFNRVKAEVSPREFSPAASVLWTLQNIPLVAQSASLVLEGKYTDPENRGTLRIGGASMIAPVSGSDFTMNAASLGGGTDLTDDFTVSASLGGNSVKFNIVNDGNEAGFITLLQVRGIVIAIKEPTIAEKFDNDSIVKYGEAVLRLTMPYQDDQLVAQDAATVMLANWKDPRSIVRSLSFYGNTSSALMEYGLRYEPGDKITITETVTGLDTDYFINGVSISITEYGKIQFTWTLAPADLGDFWVLGIVGSSETGETTLLGY